MSQTAVVTHQKAIRKDNPVMRVIGRVLLYTVLIAMALFTLIPFVWMLSSSLKLDQEVFQYPIRWIPETFHWENYRVIWERVSLLTYFKNTAIIALAVTFLQTLVIFTFVGTWNDYMGPMIYLTRDENKTIQVGLRRFIQEYTSDYHLIMAASLVSLLPVSVVFLCLQKYFIEGIATSGLKG